LVPLIKKAYGVLGFVKFIKGFYMILITQKKKVAWFEENRIYKIMDTKMIWLYTYVNGMTKEIEKKYVKSFKDFDLRQCFYFSYNYNLSHTLQENILKKVK